MKNLTRNTAAVLVLTLFTGLAVFTSIQLGDRLFGQVAGAQTATAQAAVQQAQTDDGYGGGNGYGSGGSDAYGSDDGSTHAYGGSRSTDGSAGTTMTCPATGCSASSCHAVQ